MKRNKHFGSVPIRCVKGMVLSIIVFLPVLLCGFTEIHTLENTRGGERARTLSSTSSRNQRNEGEIMQNDEASAVKKVRLSEIDSSYVNVMEYGAAGDGTSDDTAAIRKAVNAAYENSGTVYFPSGSYRISETIELPKNDARMVVLKGDGDSTIFGAETMTEDMFRISMKYNFQMIDLKLEHRGTSGSIVSALYLRAFNCSFLSGSENPSNVVAFHGSDSKIDRCTFTVSNPEAYAIYYSMLDQEISINNFIVDNVFSGAGRGILVGDGKFTDSGRCEGLKINGNIFENTGDAQIVIQEILHVDIAGNKMSGSTGSAIVLRSVGHGPDGVFINCNEISAAFSGIRTEGASDAYISMVSVSDNRFVGGQYGLYDTIGVNKGFLRDNVFDGQQEAGIYLEETENMMILSNLFTVLNEAFSLNVSGNGCTVIDGNTLGKKNRIQLSGSTIVQKI